MPDTREKAVNYRRAEWIDAAASTTLEECLRRALRVLKSVQERSFTRPTGQSIRCVKTKDRNGGGLFVHIAADTPGEAASVVPKVSAGMLEAEIGTTAAPAESEFMDGDAFLLVEGDHVCLCSTGLRDGAIRSFLYALFQKAKLTGGAQQFDLLKAANIDKVQMLHSQGVKEIVLRTTLYDATARYEKRKKQAAGILRTIAKHLHAVLGTEGTEKHDSLRVGLTIKTDGRFTDGLALGEARIEEIASNIVEEEEDYDDYIIVTKTGQKITPKEIYVREVLEMDRLGKSVSRDSAWVAINRFYSSLLTSGALEQ